MHTHTHTNTQTHKHTHTHSFTHSLTHSLTHSHSHYARTLCQARELSKEPLALPLRLSPKPKSQGKGIKKDLGFTVVTLGKLGNDVTTSSLDNTDIIPSGLVTERTMEFKLADRQYSWSRDCVDPTRPLIYLNKPNATATYKVRFKTQFDSSTNSMLYSVKAGVSTKFEVWSTSGKQAWDQFLLREKLTYSETFRSGPRLFGVSCDALQTALLAKRNTKTRVQETKTKIRTPQTRLELNEVSQKWAT